MIWLYVDTKDVDRVAGLASSIFWLVLPSLALFIALPLLLKQGYNFYLSMGASIIITVGCYWLMVTVLDRVGIEDARRRGRVATGGVRKAARRGRDPRL